MSEPATHGPRHTPAPVAAALSARHRTEMIRGLRALSRPATPAPSRAITTTARDAPSPERCDLCATTIPADHRHLLHLRERRIVCACEACWGMRAGEGDLRPVGHRTCWLEDLRVPDDLWASFQIPIGLAFFMASTVTACVVAMYPSPGGATESELHFSSWNRMLALNPVLEGLEPDIEGLIVNRLVDPPLHVIAPIDRCYELAGTIKAHWKGISGGDAVSDAVAGFFARLRAEAVGTP
ncbi:MAG TPA: DUF5947 family protein [Solirubrobacteraceae bacterium]|nr:DUF5947 family protein [Solirubrobacteraceae bacterium]